MTIKILLFATLILAFSSNAFCTLGERFEEKSGAGEKLVAKKVLKQTDSYSVHESSAKGTTIREFVRSDGTIFAVTWRGLKHPELNSLLGTYADEYKSLKKQSLDSSKGSGGRAPIAVKSSKVSVKMSGHMRDVHGEVYDPSLLPANFSLQDLKNE